MVLIRRKLNKNIFKEYFKNTGKLYDWIINLWLYSKKMNDDEVIEMCFFANHWDHEKFISDEIVINYLIKNDPSLCNFEIFHQPKNIIINKEIIYEIIKKKNQPIFYNDN